MTKTVKHSSSRDGMGGMTRAALGFRAHSGWAALVAVAGPLGSPQVIDRRRVELADPEMARPVQPYHAARELNWAEAEEYVKHFADRAKVLARQALRAVIDDLRNMGCEVVASGLLLSSGQPATTLKATLASHPLLHSAEGALFRNALTHTSQCFRVPILGVKEKEIYARGIAGLDIQLQHLLVRLVELGRTIGPPWGQDQKLASLIAWLALAGSEQGR